MVHPNHSENALLFPAECDGTGEPNIEPQVRELFTLIDMFNFFITAVENTDHVSKMC